MGISRPISEGLGLVLANFGPTLGCLGLGFGCFVPISEVLGPDFGHFGLCDSTSLPSKTKLQFVASP